jgi:hypothetical protein
MAKPKVAWVFGRALTLAALAFLYGQTSPPVDAACYTSCSGTRDSNGNCISESCNPGDSGKTTCSVAGCVCSWGSDECPPKMED